MDRYDVIKRVKGWGREDREERLRAEERERKLATLIFFLHFYSQLTIIFYFSLISIN